MKVGMQNYEIIVWDPAKIHYHFEEVLLRNKTSPNDWSPLKQNAVWTTKPNTLASPG